MIALQPCCYIHKSRYIYLKNQKERKISSHTKKLEINFDGVSGLSIEIDEKKTTKRKESAGKRNSVIVDFLFKQMEIEFLALDNINISIGISLA